MSLDLNSLSANATVSFSAYKTAYDDPNTPDPVLAYYTELAFQSSELGPSENSSTAAYAARQAEIASNSGVQAQILNQFSENKGLEVGGDAWLQIQYDKMQLDFQQRSTIVNNGDDGHLDVGELFDISKDVYVNNGLDPSIDPLHTPLQDSLASGMTPQVQSEFDELNADGSVLDFILFVDGPYTQYGSPEIPAGTPVYETLSGWADEVGWLGDMIGALAGFLNQPGAASPSDILAAQLSLNTIADYFFTSNQKILDGSADFLEGLKIIGDIGSGLADDYGWLKDNPGAVINELPPWMQGFIPAFNGSEYFASPLVLDLNNNGIELAALNGAGSVYWDIDVDGFAEASGWVSGGDGLLAIDVNGDGIINDHAELFGDQTGSANGFAALAAYDSNSDSIINNTDTQFGDLLVWVDTNADGSSQVDELHTLDDLGITSINLAYSDVSYEISGNEILQESTFTINGNTQMIVDAWFDYDIANTQYAQDYTLDIRTLFLPTLRGYGTLPDLHIAMSLDNEGEGNLLSLVQDLASQDTAALFNSSADVFGEIREILHRWAGASGVDPASRGPWANAQDLKVLEGLMGREYIYFGISPDPNVTAGSLLQVPWDLSYDALSVRLLMQTSMGSIFEEKPSYNMQTDALEGPYLLNVNVIEGIVTANNTSHTELALVWFEIFDFINKTQGLDNLTAAEVTALNTVIQGSDVSGTFDYTYFEGAVTDYATNTGDDSGNIIFGTESKFSLYGGSGDDTFVTGPNGSHMTGYEGNDTYIITADFGYDLRGSTFVYENIGEGADTIQFIGDYNYADALMWIGTYQNFYIQFGDGNPNDRLTVSASVYNNENSDIGDRVEQIIFADNTVIDLTTGFTQRDTNEAHNIYGTAYTDTIDGRGGGDIIYGYGGNDVLIGGAGGDSLRGGDGDDAYVFSPGDGDYMNVIYPSHNPDHVYEELNSGLDTIVFSGGVLIEDIRMWTDNYGLYISYSDSLDDVLHINAYSYNELLVSNYVEQITFESEQITWDLTQGLTLTDTDEAHNQLKGTSQGDTIDGRGGGDTIYGYGGNDVLIGGAGGDSLRGGDGDDAYVFSPGDGNDIIADSSGSADLIRFGAGIIQGDVTLEKVGNNLEITFSGEPSDKITINSHFNAGTSNQIEKIVFDDLSEIPLIGPTVFLGTNGIDTLAGSSGIDLLIGNAGNDDLRAKSGDDFVFGGTGDDRIEGDAGDDTLYGGVGEDLIYGEEGRDVLYGGDDDDALRGGEDEDILYGGDGDDDVRGGEADDQLFGGAGNDTLAGGYNSSDTYASNDTLDGGLGDDSLRGYLGDDTYIFGSGLDYIYDTAGSEVLKLYGSFTPQDISFADNPLDANDLVVVLNAGVDEINIENQKSSNATYHIEQIMFADGFYASLARYDDWTFSTVLDERIDGSYSKDDIIILGAGDELAYGKDGADYIHGGAGNDSIRGDNGDDLLYGGLGDDHLRGWADNDMLFGNEGVDRLDGNAGNDELHGGSGADTLRGDEGADVLYGDDGADDARGGDGDDAVFGGLGDDVLYGDYNTSDTFAGNDTLDGGAGNDTQRGGLGDDLYIVSSGLDYIYERGGHDTLRFDEVWDITALGFSADLVDTNDLIITVNAGVDEIKIENQLGTSDVRYIDTLLFADGSTASLENYSDWAFASAAGETIHGSYTLDDTMIGNVGDDSFYGKDGDDELFGGAGDDALRGNNGNDLLHGGTGDDYLRGYDGDDVLYAGAGADRMEGNAGADTFALYGTDAIDGNLNRVVDFDSAEGDVIHLIDVLEGYDPLTDAITDFITLSESTSHTYINVDKDGAGTAHSAEQTIRVENVTGEWTDVTDMIAQGDLVVV